MEAFVQWATILSPIIAVGLAWWTSRSGARDTAKLVKSIKRLMQIQLQVKMLELSKDAKEEHLQFDILLEKLKDNPAHNPLSHITLSPEELRQYEEKERDIETKKNFTFDRRIVIAEMMSDIQKLYKVIEKI